MTEATTTSFTVTKPPIYILLIYAVGQMGWAIAGAGITNMLEYFYFPPELSNGQPLFPSYVYQGAVLGAFNGVGFNRLFWAIC